MESTRDEPGLPEASQSRSRFRFRSRTRERLAGLGIVGVLGVSVLGVAAGGPEWILARHVTMAVLLLAGVAVFGRFFGAFRRGFESDAELYRLSLQVVLFLMLYVVLLQSRTAGYGMEVSRPVESAIVLLMLVGFCVSARDPRRYSPLQWLALSCLAIVLAIFFYHGLAIVEASGQARFPFWFGAIMAVGLVVLPQYVPRTAFLWAVTRYAAVIVLLALPVYVVGEYTLFGLSFGFYRSFTVPVLGHELGAARSLFVNRNAFAVVAFAGTVAAVGEFHRATVRERPTWTVLVPAALLAVNALGLAVSYGRALLVITPMAVGVYLAYIAFGRRAVPLAVVGAFAYLVTGIAVVHSGLLPLPEDTPTRATRWYPAAMAVLDEPSLLGAGIVDPGQVVSEYHPTGSTGSPHNSYLTIAIRAGLLGGFAYVLMIASSLIAGVLEVWRSDVDVAVPVVLLALGVGFAAHHQFEAYTLFNWGSSTVLAVLVFGFLLFGEQWSPIGDTSSDGSDQPGLQDP